VIHPASTEHKMPLLLLPKRSPLRESDGLLAPSGALRDDKYSLWLGSTGKVREMLLLESEQQNSRIELFKVAL
jgi:hypothetical protein